MANDFYTKVTRSCNIKVNYSFFEYKLEYEYKLVIVDGVK